MWIFALVVSSIVVAGAFVLFRDTCDLLVHPIVVARNYAIAWFCLLVFIGITKKAKLIFAAVAFFWLFTRPMIEYRIPTNESRTVWRLNEMQRKLRSATTIPKELTDIIGPDLGNSGQLNGYQFEYLPDSQGETLKHYVITARPQCYCKTGQKSFILDDSGSIHYTSENRAAMLNDPVLRQE